MTDDQILDVRIRQVAPSDDETHALCNLAMQANAWARWARIVFDVPDVVSDGELRQWIGERLSNSDLSIVRLVEDGGPTVDGVPRQRGWPETMAYIMAFSMPDGTVKTGGYESVLQAAIHAASQGYTVLEIVTVGQAAKRFV